MLARLLENHVLPSLLFVLVLVIGSLAYLQLPRQQDPTVNLNWVGVHTVLPGASAADVEKEVTDVLEDAVDRVADIKFVTSTSRSGVSSILIRFEEVDERVLDKRVNDLRREIQNRYDELPAATEQPQIIEFTSANANPSAMVLVIGAADDENLRKQAQLVEKDLERFRDIDRIDPVGERDPELQILFEPAKLQGLKVSPSALADTVTTYFRDMAAGSIDFGEQKWLVRLSGTDNDPGYLSELPIVSIQGEVPLRSVAQVVRGREDAKQLVRYRGAPAVLLAVFKKMDSNVLEMSDAIKHYISSYNQLSGPRAGVRLLLLDDQTAVTRKALSVMEGNALLGLVLVLLTTGLFLGARMALLTSIGIPFTLAGTFWFLYVVDQTLNVVVLLGVVIALGMLVDDTVVVGEAIHRQLQRGLKPLQAVLAALQEVFAPVAASVMTTIAAFLPLMLLPGVLGKFMLVAPLVVTVALMVSLIEAFWMLPSHIVAFGNDVGRQSRSQRLRERGTRWLRIRYVRVLIGALRRPKLSLMLAAMCMVGAVLMLAAGMVRVEFFATDLARLFYVNVEMPAGTRMEKTLSTTMAVEDVVRRQLRGQELHAMAAYAGIRYTDRQPLFGDHNGQVMVSLAPRGEGGRNVDDIIDALREAVERVPGPSIVSFLRVTTGAPPTAKPVSIKVRGDDLARIRQAADRVVEILRDIPGLTDIGDDDAKGRMELALRLKPDAISRAGLDPAVVIRDIRLFTDGEVVASMRDRGEKLDVRVRARPKAPADIGSFLRHQIARDDGSSISLGQLLHHDAGRGKGNIRHYNLRRAITVEAELDKQQLDTPTAIRLIREQWQQRYAADYTDIDLDFTGEFDDIQESLDAIAMLFLFGIGLIYIILSTQFKSYVKPFIVLVTLPMAFTGVVFGLAISANPLSVYTLYGVVALAGIAVNSAIVLISAANDRVARGMTVVHATVYAARRRLIPIVITTATTMAGLFSLAVGLGGKSLMWGPLAASIVWGLGVSTLLTLFMVPLLYNGSVRGRMLELTVLPLPRALPDPRPSPFSRLAAAFRVGALTGVSKTEQYEALEEIADDPELRALYSDGVRLLAEKEYIKALHLFERVTNNPEMSNGIFHVCAAQTLVMYMRDNGEWNRILSKNVERHLAAARSLAPGDLRLPLLQRAIDELTTENTP